MSKILDVIATIFTLFLLIGASWAAMIGGIKLISLCFGFEFSLKIATGIWFVIWFLWLFLRSIKE